MYYPRVVWDYEIYRDHPLVTRTDDVIETHRAAREVLSLPVHPLLTPEQVEAVAEAIVGAFAAR